MPARSAQAIQRKYRNRKVRNQHRRNALILKLGNMCEWYRMGDCEGELQLHHRFGHPNDEMNHWCIQEYEKLFREGKLGLLCRKHNHADGQRRRIFKNEF